MKVLVCGGRDYTNWLRFEDEMHLLWRTEGDFSIISGGARGADRMAEQYAELYDCELEVFAAEWDKHGKAAGTIRNKKMLEEGKPDLVIAFPGGKGTEHMKKISKEAGIRVIEIEDNA